MSTIQPAGGSPANADTRVRSGSTASTGSAPGSSSAKHGGFFHSVKKALTRTEHSGDSGTTFEVRGTPTNPELLGFSHGFQGLQQDTNKLRQYVLAYHSHLTGLLDSGKAVTEVLDRLLHSTDPEHVAMANGLRDQHQKLAEVFHGHTSEHATSMTSTLTNMENELEKTAEYHNQVQNRISHRNHLGSEVEYYAKKFEGLQLDRQKRAGSGKVEKPADVDKYDRNQRKLTDVRQEYLDASATMTEELRALLNARGQLYGRTLLHFSQVERELGHLLVEANQASEGVAIPEQVPLTQPTIVGSATMMTNVGANTDVNQELPALNQAASTSLTSGQTRATDGTELLAKNQIVLPPENSAEYNVAHPYDDKGNLRVDAENTPRAAVPVEKVYGNDAYQHQTDSGYVGQPTTIDQVKALPPLPLKPQTQSVASVDGPRHQSEESEHADLAQQVKEQLKSSGVPVGEEAEAPHVEPTTAENAHIEDEPVPEPQSEPTVHHETGHAAPISAESEAEPTQPTLASEPAYASVETGTPSAVHTTTGETSTDAAPVDQSSSSSAVRAENDAEADGTGNTSVNTATAMNQAKADSEQSGGFSKILHKVLG